MMVSDSLHPVGKSLREALMIARGSRTVPGVVESLEEETGSGVLLKADGIQWRLGRPEWTGSDATTAECVFSRDGRTLAVFAFAETLRPEAQEQVAILQRRGYRVCLLSGDRRAKVLSLARQLDLPVDAVLAEASPQDKAELLRKMEQEALMIGDGANDALAFRQALCSGTPAIDRGLLENRADFYFTGTGLQGLCRLLDLAACHGRAVRRVMGFTIAYNAVVVVLSLSGWIYPLLAALLMPASSMVSLALVAWSYGKRNEWAKAF